MAMRSEPRLQSVGKTYGMRVAGVWTDAAADGGLSAPRSPIASGTPPESISEQKKGGGV